MIGNPVSDKGRGAKVGERVRGLLEAAGAEYGFDVLDLTGASFDDSLARARAHAAEYDHLVVVGGDGMIALGANAVGTSGIPLGIVAIGSGNDFARGLKLPIDRVDVAVEGIVGAIVRGSHLDVDMGHVTSLPGGRAVDPSTGAEIGPSDGSDGSDGSGDADGDAPAPVPIDRYYAGMLSCGLDSSINDRANHSRLPNGKLRYLAAALVELTRMKRYGYRIRVTMADGTVDEREVVTPLLTVANSRHIGGGIELAPYSRFADGLLDLVWARHVPNALECVEAVSKAYGDRLLGCRCLDWRRIREIEIDRASEGDEPPVLMADGEYVGYLPVRVSVRPRALRVLVPPAVAAEESRRTEIALDDMLARDGRDPETGAFADGR
ncbi:DeoR family transcriptional regulator [Bifidobacterium sp. DSM 109958]|uniref:DeoR family transcriptional regulator n=2 Tax=Bifidobacterium moraviense TaxID=2675323 RepID=A0A7Y0HZA2_9BIFI|nr:DeoR family transcriptional regulator [Bifidobacterium sp. DSM 109958]